MITFACADALMGYGFTLVFIVLLMTWVTYMLGKM